jgi:hypothetical protein
MQACYDRLRKICGVVVRGDDQVEFRCIDSSDPRRVGTTVSVTADFKVFLVNESDHDLTNIEMSTGGFEGDSQLNRVTKNLGALKRSDVLLLDELDYGMLDFNIWYHFLLTFPDIQLKAWFDIGRTHSLTHERYRYCDVLKKEGYYFGMKLLVDCSNMDFLPHCAVPIEWTHPGIGKFDNFADWVKWISDRIKRERRRENKK